MKKRTLFAVFFIGFLFNNCQDPSIKFNPTSVDNIIIVPDNIEPQESINDPQQSGVACNPNQTNRSNTELIDVIEIPLDLPIKHDLSDDMPPVRSQGNQGSCVAWATTYYLKSYQEKIQHDYEYLSYNEVMSPAFVYNQAKQNANCLSGSSIEESLEILKTKGVNTWKDFPYSQSTCSNLPTEELLSKATVNKIKEYFRVGIPETNTDVNYTLINLIKTLIFQKNPIIISLDWKDLIFETIDGETVATSFSQNPTDECGHAVLIVGYDNEMSAFKIVNSWGTSWGNEGYGWVSYKFFLPDTDSEFEDGLRSSHIAYDED